MGTRFSHSIIIFEYQYQHLKGNILIIEEVK